MSDEREIGSLTPFRELLEWITAWESDDRGRRGEDAVVVTLASVRVRMEDAMHRAEDPTRALSPEQYAAAKGLSVWTVYKTWGRIPGARKNPHSKRIEIPLEAAA